MSTREQLTAQDCLDYGRSPCSGPVEFRYALSGTGRSFPRCDGHWAERVEEQERISERYPDSPCPPSWFDPAAVGESWDEEE